MAATVQQQYDVSTLAALGWAWMSLVDEGAAPVAQESMLRAFQQQYNARLASLRALQAGGESIAHPLRTLATDGRYGTLTAQAIYNVSALAVSGSTSAFASLPSRFDANMISLIWDEIRRAYPVNTSSQAGRTMWAMLRNIIGAPAEQVGQIAVNTAYQLWAGRAGGTSPTSYTPTAPLVKDPGQVAVPLYGTEQWTTTERVFTVEDGRVQGRRQQSTSSLALIGVLAIAGVGIMVASAYKGRLA